MLFGFLEVIASKERSIFNQAQAFSYQTDDGSISFLKTSRKGDCVIFLGKLVTNVFVTKISLKPKELMLHFLSLSFLFLKKLLSISADFFLPNTFPVCHLLSIVLLFQNSFHFVLHTTMREISLFYFIYLFL